MIGFILVLAAAIILGMWGYQKLLKPCPCGG
jgi:hypothetical protein